MDAPARWGRMNSLAQKKRERRIDSPNRFSQCKIFGHLLTGLSPGTEQISRAMHLVGFAQLSGVSEPAYRIDWNYSPHARSPAIRVYSQLAVHFIEPLTHSGQADAGFRACLTESIQALGGDATAVVANFQDDIFGVALKTDHDLRGASVAMHIGQALL